MRWVTHTLHPSVPDPPPLPNFRSQCAPPVLTSTAVHVRKQCRELWSCTIRGSGRDETHLWSAAVELTSGAIERHKRLSSLFSGEFIDGLQMRIIVKHSLRDICIMETSSIIAQLFFFFLLRVRRSSLKAPLPFFRDQRYTPLRQIACARAGQDLRERK